MDRSVILFFLLIVIFIFSLFIIRKENIDILKGQFMKHSVLFLISFFVVFFQSYFDFILGNIEINNLSLWINHAIVIKSMILSIIALLCFLLGYLCYKKKIDNTKKIDAITKMKVVPNMYIYILLLIATILLVVYFYTVNPLYLIGYYGDEKMGSTAQSAIFYFNILLYVIIIQNNRNMSSSNKIPRNIIEYVRYQGYYLLGLIIIYLLSVMFSGDRGPIMTIGICYFSGYFILTRKKMSTKWGILLIFLATIFITVLGLVRNLDKDISFGDRLQQSFYNEKVSPMGDASFSPYTKELSGSVKAWNIVVNYIPKHSDYLYGRFQFQQIFDIIYKSDLLYNVIFEDNSPKYNSPAKFVTWIHQGDFALHGNGSTCISDLYCDFGLIGIIIGMFIWGLFLRNLEIKMYSNITTSLSSQVFSIIYFSNSIYIPRSSILFPFQIAVCTFFLLFFLRFLSKRKSV
jgi:oligosaccharide repeat unit polymerase